MGASRGALRHSRQNGCTGCSSHLRPAGASSETLSRWARTSWRCTRFRMASSPRSFCASCPTAAVRRRRYATACPSIDTGSSARKSVASQCCTRSACWKRCLFLGERLLRDTDAASMASSLEVRLPLIDHRVLESAARLAPADRFEPLGRKPILRACLDGLDPSLFERPKSGFELPLQVWCRQRLSGRLAECLTSVERCRRVGLRVDATTRLWQGFRAGAPGLYWSRVWALFVLLEVVRTLWNPVLDAIA